MWCYQKPGFEALIVTELQRQQRCSQFCDTLLKAEDVSVPAHSCILSAISSDMFSALSSTPTPPAGQRRLLEFRALGACTLLHMVKLLYSGEMAGEGEKEKQEAISAATKLGIHGLVEVTKRDHKTKNREGVSQFTEVGVQTEPLRSDENEGRDESTLLWKETLSNDGKDMWTQTEELQINIAALTHPAASFETIDVGAFESLTQTDYSLVPSQIVPLSFVCPPNENQTPQPASAPATVQESTAGRSTSIASLPSSLPHFPSQTTLCVPDPQSCWAAAQAAGRDVAEEWESEHFEQFQGNIPGFINYFLNPDKEEGSCRGRAGRRRGAGVEGARRAGTGQRRVRRPRGGYTQKVDTQEVGVGSLQKLFLHRWKMRAPRTGQGGGAVGRKLNLMTRQLLKSGTSSQRRRWWGKAGGLSQGGDVSLCINNGGGNSTQHEKKNTAPQFNQDSVPVGRARRSRAKSTASASCSFLPMQIYNVHALAASSPSLQPSPSSSLLSPAASYVSPSSSRLHTTSLPPQAPLPQQDQPEHIDRLLEEVMMGLNILPNNSSAPHSQNPLPTSSHGCTFASSDNKQQSWPNDPHRSTEAADGGVPVLQQQCEGELNEMLDHFLQSFEQHIESCSAREEEDMGSGSSTEADQPYAAVSKYKKSKIQSRTSYQQDTHARRQIRRSQTTKLHETPRSCSPPRKASARCGLSPECTEGTQRKVRAQAKRSKRRTKQYMLSLEKPKLKVKTPSDGTKIKIVHDGQDKQLRLMPVVKLERTRLLPVRMTLQEHSFLENKTPARTQTGSSAVKVSRDTLSGKSQPAFWETKNYPIRSRFREVCMENVPFLEESLLLDKQPPAADQPHPRRGRPKKNRQLLSLSKKDSLVSPIQPQAVDLCSTYDQLKKNQERLEKESTVHLQEEAEGCTRRGKKRGAESNEGTSDGPTEPKMVCFEQTAQPTCETCVPSSKSADFVSEPAITELEEVVNVETVSLTSVGDCSEAEKHEEKTVWSEIKLRESEEGLMNEETESSADEIIDVEGDHNDSENKETDGDHSQCRTAPTLSHVVDVKPFVSPSHPAKDFGLESTGSWVEDEDEDIDVIGGSSPTPDPVIINWIESSEGEEEEEDEDVDVVGEKADCISSAIFTSLSKGEQANVKCQTRVLLQ